MIDAMLTTCARAAHGARMDRGRIGLAAAMVMATSVGGCINVKAPDKPIVIELNVNIKQEVIYRLAEDAGNTIENNPDIF